VALKRLWIYGGLLFFLFLLVTRTAVLGYKPYHHDESLYAIEAWRYATQGMYQFNPMLHGPFLFHIHAALFNLLPINDVTGRLPVVISGLLFPLVGLVLLRKQPPAALLTWLALCALSPVLCFFSRFLGMDLPMVCLGIILVACLSYLLETGKIGFLYGTAVVATFMICTKLNFLFYFFSIFTFIAIWWFYRWLTKEAVHQDHLSKAWDYVKRHHWDVLMAIGTMILLYCLFYSSFGRNKPGILDGLGISREGQGDRNMISYWVNQHKIQRIKGPFQYYLPILGAYELPLVVALLWAAFHAAGSSRFLRAFSKRLWIGSALVGGICMFNWDALGPFLSGTFHFDSSWHFSLALLEFWLGFVLVLYHFQRGELLAAFCAYWGTISLLIYSYAGEKIPWLTTHIIMPYALYVAIIFPTLLSKVLQTTYRKAIAGALLATAIFWQGYITIRSSFTHSADPAERLVYTHTSWDILNMVRGIEELAQKTGEKENLQIQVVGESSWPLYWYLRDYKRWFYLDPKPEEKPYLLVVDWEKRQAMEEALKDQYTLERRKLREWWLYEIERATMADVINYYFFRKAWSELGSQDIAVFVRNDIVDSWRQLTPGDKRTRTP
jgi:uncharacterized protein (TIGR03663 family)